MTSNTPYETRAKLDKGSKDKIKEAINRSSAAIEESTILKIAAIIAIVCCISVLAYVSYVNVGPYVEFVQKFNSGKNWLELLPFVGGVVKFMDTTASVVVGFLLWALIQTGQVLWILIMLDRKATRSALKEQASDSQLYDTKNKDFVVRRISKRQSRVPLLFIRWSYLLALFAYVVDFFVGMSMFPPAKSLQSFLLSITIGASGSIYWNNVFALLLMMFAFEPLFFITVIIAQWIKAHKNG